MKQRLNREDTDHPIEPVALVCTGDVRTRRTDQLKDEGQRGQEDLACEKEDDTSIADISFHKKRGEWVEIINSNKTAYRKKADTVDTGGLVFTNRPLKKNEMFEVSLDKKNPRWKTWSWALGVTAVSPDDLKVIPQWIADIRDGTFYVWETNVSKNAGRVITNYGSDLRYMEVGDRLGAMVNSSGELHFFHNGEDMGTALKGMGRKTLYGVVDIRNCAEQVTLTS